MADQTLYVKLLNNNFDYVWGITTLEGHSESNETENEVIVSAQEPNINFLKINIHLSAIFH